MKATGITASICLLLAFLFTAGEPDLIDAIQVRLLVQEIGLCQKMVPPVAVE